VDAQLVRITNVIPCAEDDGATNTIHGLIQDCDFASLGVARSARNRVLFLPDHCAVFKVDASVIVISERGTFSVTRAGSIEWAVSVIVGLVKSGNA
jgi:hypothetical protein